MSISATKPPVEPNERVERQFTLDGVEFREEGDSLRFTGYAAVFDKLSDDLGGFRERIQRGAFRKVLTDAQDVRFLINHDRNLLLARTASGTMSLREKPKGLLVEADLAPTSYAADLRTLVKRGDMSGMSIGFRVGFNEDGVPNDLWEEGEDGGLLRTIVSFDELYDVSPVTFPAYPQTDAQVRSKVCGVEIITSGGEVQEAHLRDLANRIHRGDVQATTEERGAVDAAFAKTDDGVSPWMAQRALRADQPEPEPQGAVDAEDETRDDGDGTSTGAVHRAAWSRRLDLLTH